MSSDLIVRSRRVVTPAGIGPAAIHIRDGVIRSVRVGGEAPRAAAEYDAGDLVVMPGLVDTHVHINEPGRTGWEGFACATRAAAAGGVTTLIDMPLNSIPATTSRDAFHQKLAAARGQCWVDVGFWGGVVPTNGDQLRPLYEAGVFGFKCFLVPSGVPEFAAASEADLRAALPELAALGATLLVHAEWPEQIQPAEEISGDPRRYRTWLASRPPAAEVAAIEILVRLAREFGVHVHVVHLSASEALELFEQARAERLPVSVETCPHYLTFAAEEIPDGATEFKCAPPIRSRDNAERLWEALGAGLISLVASDHSPSPPEMKCRDTGDFLRAWGGIASLQLSLSVVWTEARRRGHSLADLAEWMCAAPARLAGLEQRKGAIAAGRDADLVVWKPDATFAVDPAGLHHRHRLTPYAGRVLAGVVEATFLRGRKIYESGRLAAEPAGTLLLRGAA
jgi:allantoinase